MKKDRRQATADREILTDKEKQKRRREWLKAYREKYPQMTAEINKRWKKKNPEKVAEQKKRYREKNREKIKKYQKSYRKANPEKCKKWYLTRRNKKRNSINEWKRKASNELRDYYVKKRLVAGSTLSFSDIPDEIIELKRLQLIAKRLLKQREGDHGKESHQYQ